MTFPSSQNWSFACNRNQVNCNAKLLGVQMLQAGRCQAKLELFIVSLSLIYLQFEKSVIKTKNCYTKMTNLLFQVKIMFLEFVQYWVSLIYTMKINCRWWRMQKFLRNLGQFGVLIILRLLCTFNYGLLPHPAFHNTNYVQKLSNYEDITITTLGRKLISHSWYMAQNICNFGTIFISG